MVVRSGVEVVHALAASTCRHTRRVERGVEEVCVAVGYI
jgi:hypothetical protein